MSKISSKFTLSKKQRKLKDIAYNYYLENEIYLFCSARAILAKLFLEGIE